MWSRPIFRPNPDTQTFLQNYTFSMILYVKIGHFQGIENFSDFLAPKIAWLPTRDSTSLITVMYMRVILNEENYSEKQI